MALKKLILLFAIVLLSGGLLQNCSESLMDPVDEAPSELILQEKESGSTKVTKDKATGSVEIIWKGGNGNNSDVEPKRAFAGLTAHQAYGNKPARGEFIYQIKTEEMILKREIIAEVHKVEVEAPYTWVVAKVISDSKGCNGGDTPDGHSVDCPGRISGGSDSGHDEGCGGDDSGGGCSGDDHTGGGSSGGSGGSDSGCGEDHPDDGTDGGCSGDDHSGGSPGGNSTNPKGHSCRTNQRVFIMVYDGGTPGTNGDEISWKWFYQTLTNRPHWGNFEDWHLCTKTIIGGNLVVHSKSALANF